MDSGITTWSGSQDEWHRLYRALEANCTCESRITDPTGERCAACPVRLLNSQAALDRLGFGRSIARHLIVEEMTRKRAHG